MQPFTLPKPFSQLFSILPQYPHSLAFAQALNLALGETLRSEALQPLHGKLIFLKIKDAQIALHQRDRRPAGFDHDFHRLVI